MVSKRVFDTEIALHATFDRFWGKWQIITYIGFSLGYAIIIGWLQHLIEYTLLVPSQMQCDYSDQLAEYIKQNMSYTNRSVIQRLSGKSKYVIINGNESIAFNHVYNQNEFGNTVATDFEIFCDIEPYLKMPKFSQYIGFIVGSLMLGIASDKGGRKIIILACIWTAGIMSIFQIVGHDFISFVFFQFFLGLFIGGVQASFVPAIIEMFPINFRAFYGVAFHLVVCLFELVLPWLAKSFKSWKILQLFVTTPVLLTAVLQWLVYESIFWFLAHKEYDKVIEVLTRLSKRNGFSFADKFPQADEFKHAKHSKATQVDIMPLLRLQDVELLGKKYPQVDMVELQKQKINSSKLRRFLNSLKGASYTSTNTIYRPFDFIYSPTLLVYVIILGGLWFTNGLTDSMEAKSIRDSIKRVQIGNIDFYLEKTFLNLTCILSSLFAVILALLKMDRKLPIFSAYLVIEVCLLGSLIAEYNPKENQNDDQKNLALLFLYQVCKFASHFGYIFVMLITAELFPTSLRCTGVGFCFVLKMLGSLIASPDLGNYNQITHRIAYCLLTLFFGAMTLFLPETKTKPLPRSILHIEAMGTAIGKLLRSRKVQLAVKHRQNQYTDVDYNNKMSQMNDPNYSNLHSVEDQGKERMHLISLNQSSQSPNDNDQNNSTRKSLVPDPKKPNGTPAKDNKINSNYDTVTSFHDIEQDDHKYYNKEQTYPSRKLFSRFDKNTLQQINEFPSKSGLLKSTDNMDSKL